MNLKTNLIRLACLLHALFALVPTGRAQGTTFTFQGRLAENNVAASGNYDLRFTLYGALTDGSAIGSVVTNTAANVSNGLFTVALDFGSGAFDGSARWLEIAIRTNGSAQGFVPLTPRQRVTATPYAIRAENAANAAVATTVAPGSIGVAQLQASSVNSEKIADGAITAADVNSASFSNTFWKLDGNAGSTPGTHFLGTTDNQPLELRVNGARALRLEPTAGSNAVNVIGGSARNSVGPSVEAATIAGGGSESSPNTIIASYATIGGGISNRVAGSWSTIAGGTENNVTGDYSTVSGGAQNVIVATADAATIGGGDGNLIQSSTTWPTIGGGRLNVVRSNNFSPTIAGGEKNVISTNASFSSIGGGLLNSVASENTTVGGGRENSIQTNSFNGTISGGSVNTIRSNSWRATIGGGVVNTVGAPEGTIAGGAFNSALAFSSTIGGGGGNAASGEWSTIAGGRDNQATNAHYSTIGGGVQNTIQPGGFAATIPGGWLNSAADYGFAAGRRAKANHTGAFVWADATDADHFSTGTNQFLIRASGGVGINNNNPNGAALAVNGNITVEGIIYANALSAASLTTPEVITPRISAPGSLPLELRVNSERVLRIESTGGGPNWLGGYSGNIISNGVEGGFIGGGGNAGSLNVVGGNYASVLGGAANTSIGHASTAMGDGTYSSGARSTAMGWSTIARGDASTAMGFQTTASGQTATAMGVFTRATGDGATAMGATTTASEHASTAMGYQTTASGPRSTAMGYQTTASGEASTATGNGTTASGINSFASGEGSMASELATTAMGYHTRATAPGATSLGVFSQANHANTFVWSDGSVNPFASSTNNQFLIHASGGVGIGTSNPRGSLHVYSANNPTVVRVQSTGTPGFGRVEFVSNPQGDANEWRPGYIQSTDNGGFTGGLSFVVNGTGAANKFAEVETMRIQNGRVGIGTAAPVSALQVVGTVTATAFNPPSDRNLKENFTSVQPREVLEKVMSLSISRWNFKGDTATPHVGPMAQDFHAAFGLGTDERHIATVDADGVALAAIQGLNAKLEEALKARDAELQALKETVAGLQRAMQQALPAKP